MESVVGAAMPLVLAVTSLHLVNILGFIMTIGSLSWWLKVMIYSPLMYKRVATMLFRNSYWCTSRYSGVCISINAWWLAIVWDLETSHHKIFKYGGYSTVRRGNFNAKTMDEQTTVFDMSEVMYGEVMAEVWSKMTTSRYYWSNRIWNNFLALVNAHGLVIGNDLSQ